MTSLVKLHPMMPAGDESYVATVKVQLSPTFWGWLDQFGNKMKVISLDTVIEEYKKKSMK